MPNVVILTGHFARQKRKPSMLWIAEHLQEIGWHVHLVTVGYSWVSRLVRDKRLRSLGAVPKSGTHRLAHGLTSTFGFSPVHPFSTHRAWLDRLIEPIFHLFRLYWMPRLRAVLDGADLVIVESGPPVMLAALVRRFAPNTRIVYRVNDDLAALGAPPCVQRAEQEVCRHVDRISTASPHLARHFDPGLTTLDPMGIPHAVLNEPRRDPFSVRAPFEAVCAGTSHMDLAALCRIAKQRPHWRLHVLGALGSARELPPNVVCHGEVSYEKMVSFVAHADVGLAPYRDGPGVEYQVHNSNRMALYRHFGIPILGPDRLRDPSLPGYIGYGDPCVWARCETRRRSPESLPDWSELARRLTLGQDQKARISPPPDVAMLPAST